MSLEEDLQLDYNGLADIVKWLMAHGAPAPTLKTLHATYPGGIGWDWDTLEFPNAHTPESPYVLSIPTLMGNADTNLSASVALTEMQRLGIAEGDPNVRTVYTPPMPPPPPHPHPVDDVVGLERPDEAGAFDGATYYDWISYTTRKIPYTTATGRKFGVKMRGSGFNALYLWVEIK